MKKSLVFMIAVLLVGALMISCNSDVTDTGKDSVSSVKVAMNGFGGDSKALSTSTEATTKASDMYWYYTAVKADTSIFTTGQTTEKTAVPVTGRETGILSGAGHNEETALGDFSTGSWTFSFWGYKYAKEVKALDVADNMPVYQCVNLSVTVSGTTYINVTVEAVDVGDTIIKFNAPYWVYNNPSAYGKALTLKVFLDNSTESVYATSTSAAVIDDTGKATFTVADNTLTAGAHILTFKVYYAAEEVGSTVLNVHAKAGHTLTISGSIENADVVNAVIISTLTETKATGSVAAVDETYTDGKNTEEKTVVANISPASASSSTALTTGNTTTVSFPADVVVNEKTTVGDVTTTVSHELTVDVSSLVAASSNTSFSVTSGNTSVAAIDLSLVKTTAVNNVVTSSESVNQFTDANNTAAEVTIETYIAKNLTNVVVKYNKTGEEDNVVYTSNANSNGVHGPNLSSNGTGYIPSTGKLVFKTTHFSEFYVTSTSEAINSTTGVAYGKIKDAIDNAAAGNTIVLLKNASVSEALLIGKSLILDGDKKTLTFSSNRGIRINASDVSFTLKNITIRGGDNFERAVQVDTNMKNVYLVLDKVDAKATLYAINFCNNTSVDVKIDGSTIEGWGALNIWSSGIRINAKSSTFIGMNTYSSFSNNFATIILEADTTKVSDMHSSNMQISFDHCTLNASRTGSNIQSVIGFNASKTTGAFGNSVALNNCSIIIGDGCEFAFDNGNDNTLTWSSCTVNNKNITDGTWNEDSLVPNDIVTSIGNAVEYHYMNEEEDTINCKTSFEGLIDSSELYHNFYKPKGLNGLYYLCDGEWFVLLQDVCLSKSVTINLYYYGQESMSGTFGIICGDNSLTKNTGVELTIPVGVTIATDKNLGTGFFKAPSGYSVISTSVPSDLPYNATYAYTVQENQ